MMKRKFLAVVLPIVGCATLVGSGFSAWTFSELNANTKDGSFDTTIDVPDKVITDNSVLSMALADSGTITGDDYLILDQGVANTADPNYNSKGIMFSTQKVGDVQARDIDLILNASYDNQDLALNRLPSNGMYIDINVRVFLSKTLLKYVSVKPDAEFAVSDGASLNATTDMTPADSEDNQFTIYTYNYKPTLRGDTSTKKTRTLTLDLATNADLINSYLTYKARTGDADSYTGGKPTSESDYDQMEDVLNEKADGSHFKVEYEIKLAYV